MVAWIRRLLCIVLCCTAAHAGEPSTEAPGGTELRALSVLKGLQREWSGTSDHDCKTYEDKNIDKLSRPFAMAAAAFLEAFVRLHGAVTITSAHRTAEEQACVCIGEKGPCAGKPYVVKVGRGRTVTKVGTSRHQEGIALDVRPGTGSEDEFICLHEFAKLNPQFGVHFPLGRYDYPHMEPLGSRSGNIQMAALRLVPSRVPAKAVACKKMRIMLTHNHLD